jgi:hypothetical protein
MKIQGFKPNLVPNNPKDGSFTEQERQALIDKNGGLSGYYAVYKKDGCRMQLGVCDKILTRSLKEPKSELVKQRFAELNQICLDLNIALDGEFYMHGLKFNEIFRFFSKSDVTSEKYKEKFIKEFKKDPEKFIKDYNGRTVQFLTTLHEGLKFWLFDGIIIDRPDLVGYKERMQEIYKRLLNAFPGEEIYDKLKYLEIPDLIEFTEEDSIDSLYLEALDFGFEGLIIIHKDHEYKMGRTRLSQGTILKVKDDAQEFDGVILDVEEGTKIKEGVERGKNELGRSTTSKKKGDREPSGKAKGFVVQFKDLGTFTVALRGFNDASKIELLKNKDKYIGRHFKYTAMPPTKDFPRHAFFNCWRDEK